MLCLNGKQSCVYRFRVLQTPDLAGSTAIPRQCAGSATALRSRRDAGYRVLSPVRSACECVRGMGVPQPVRTGATQLLGERRSLGFQGAGGRREEPSQDGVIVFFVPL